MQEDLYGEPDNGVDYVETTPRNNYGQVELERSKTRNRKVMTLQELNQLAEQSWEGCDGCDENDKYFFMKGFQAGYNTAKPDEISDDEKNDEYLLKCLTIFSNKLLESEQSKNDGIPRLMYKDGREIRSYHSPKLQAIEMEISDEEALRLAKEMNKQSMIFVLDEISDEEIEKAAKKCRFEDLDISVGSFELGAKWYRKQLKRK